MKNKIKITNQLNRIGAKSSEIRPCVSAQWSQEVPIAPDLFCFIDAKFPKEKFKILADRSDNKIKIGLIELGIGQILKPLRAIEIGTSNFGKTILYIAPINWSDPKVFMYNIDDNDVRFQSSNSNLKFQCVSNSLIAFLKKLTKEEENASSLVTLRKEKFSLKLLLQLNRLAILPPTHLKLETLRWVEQNQLHPGLLCFSHANFPQVKFKAMFELAFKKNESIYIRLFSPNFIPNIQALKIGDADNGNYILFISPINSNDPKVYYYGINEEIHKGGHLLSSSLSSFLQKLEIRD